MRATTIFSSASNIRQAIGKYCPFSRWNDSYGMHPLWSRSRAYISYGSNHVTPGSSDKRGQEEMFALEREENSQINHYKCETV